VAWYCSRWYKIFTPENCGQPKDDFSQLIDQIRSDGVVQVKPSEWDEIDSLRIRLRELGLPDF